MRRAAQLHEQAQHRALASSAIRSTSSRRAGECRLTSSTSASNSRTVRSAPTVPRPIRTSPSGSGDSLTPMHTTPPDPDTLTSEASHLLHQAAAAGYLAAFDLAVQRYATVVAITPAGHQRLGIRLNNLGYAYFLRYTRSGLDEDAGRAVQAGEQAVAAVHAGDRNIAVILSNLATTYITRYQRVARPGDLDRVLQLSERVLDLADADISAAVPLSTLVAVYLLRYESTGQIEDLDRAVEYGGRAVAAADAGDANRATALNNLATVHRHRFIHTGHLADLDHAVEHSERAVAALPQDHAAIALHLSNLEVALHARFNRTGAEADLARALETSSTALDLTPADHPIRADRLVSLGRIHLSLSEHTGSMADLDRATALVRAAAESVPDTHPDYAAYLVHIAEVERERFARTGKLADLDQAIEALERSVALLPTDHSRLGVDLTLLGDCYIRRWNAGGALDASRVVTLATLALAATTARPSDRVRACWAAGRLSFVLGVHQSAQRLMDAALSMLPLVAARESARADQEYRLGANHGLVGETIAAYCALDNPAGAVRAGEQGRAILLAQALDLRTPLAELAAQHPQLALRYLQARDALDASGPVSRPDLRARLWAAHDRVLAEVRGLPSFTRFLQPPEWTDLQPAAAGGAVVLLNAALQRSDEIIVTADGPPVLVPLPELRLVDVEQQVTEVTEATTASGVFADELRRQRVLGELLGWLWDKAVGPVLAALPAEVMDADRPTRAAPCTRGRAPWGAGRPGPDGLVLHPDPANPGPLPLPRPAAGHRPAPAHRRAGPHPRPTRPASHRRRGGRPARPSPRPVTAHQRASDSRRGERRWTTPAGRTSLVTPAPDGTRRPQAACTYTTECCQWPR